MSTFVKLSNAIMSSETSEKKTDQCNAAVKCNTHGNAIKSVLNGTPTYLNDGIAYYRCMKKGKDGETCSRHKGAKSLIMFKDVVETGELLSKEHPYIQKHMPKYLDKQGKKSILPTPSISESNISFSVDISLLELSNEEKNTLTSQIQESAKKFIDSYKESKLSSPDCPSIDDVVSEKLPEPELSIDSDEEEKDDECESTIKTLIHKSEKMDKSSSDEEDDEEVPCQESDAEEDEESNEHSDDEDCLELTEIESKKGNSYGLDENNNSVYDPDTGDELGKLIKVIDTKSSVSYEDEDYCIGENIEIDDTTYIKCILTERLYDFDSKKLIGVLGKKKDGSLKIRKSKK
mgnify:CR=1 FL=1